MRVHQHKKVVSEEALICGGRDCTIWNIQPWMCFSGPWIPSVYTGLPFCHTREQWESSPKRNNEMFLLECIISSFWKVRLAEVEGWSRRKDMVCERQTGLSHHLLTYKAHTPQLWVLRMTHGGDSRHQILPPHLWWLLKLSKELTCLLGLGKSPKLYLCYIGQPLTIVLNFSQVLIP